MWSKYFPPLFSLRLWSLVSAACLASCGGLPSIASSTFNRFNEDWTIVGDAAPKPELRGDPNGHICGTDLNTGDIWYFEAPDKFQHDVSRAYGKRLIFDLKQSRENEQLRGQDVMLFGGGYQLIYNLRGTPGTKWTSYSVFLDATSGWLHKDTKVPATETEIRATMSNVTSFRIRGEYADGPDTGCLDNVYFGTP
jgi:hypothetical protein